MNDKVKKSQSKTKSNLRFALAIILTIVITATCVSLFKAYVIDSYRVDGTSMEQTLHDGDIVWASKLAKAERGDIVVLDVYGVPGTTATEKERFYVKRLIGFEGDRIWQEGTNIYRYDGVTVECVRTNAQSRDNLLWGTSKEHPYCVGEGKCFVLGDNTNLSLDSRAFGCVEVERIKAVILGK